MLADTNPWRDQFPQVKESIDDGGERVYGYRLGAVADGSREKYVDAVVGDGDGVLGPAEAGLDRAVLTVNRYFTSMINAGIGGLPMSTMPSGKGSYIEPKKYGDAGDESELTPERELEQVYGHFLVVLTSHVMAKQLGRPPEVGEIADAVAEMYQTSSIPAGPLLELLVRGDDDDRALGEALSARGVG